MFIRKIFLMPCCSLSENQLNNAIDSSTILQRSQIYKKNRGGIDQIDAYSL